MGSRPFDGGDDLVTRPRPWMFVRVDRVLFIGAPIRTEAAWYSKTPTPNFLEHSHRTQGLYRTRRLSPDALRQGSVRLRGDEPGLLLGTRHTL
jgi:hypothetical protein